MMKKILLGTTALFGASVLMAGAAMASDPPKVVLSGYTKVEAWFLSQDDQSTGGAQNRGYAISLDDSEFHLNAKATADNGLEYGAHMEIKVDKNTTTDESSIWFQGPWGWLEVGRNDGAEDVIKVYGANVMGGDGAWDGSAIYSTPTGWGANSNSLHAPTSVGDTGDANKITYFTPSFSGFRAGVSLTPDSGDNLHVSAISDTSSAQYDNSVDFGVEYKGTFNDVGVHVSGRYMTGDYEGNNGAGVNKEKKDVNSWAIGAQVDYQGFSLAAGYADNGHSGVTVAQKNAGADAGSYYDVGLAYSTGPYKIAAGYFHAETKISTTAGKDEVDWYAVTGDYTVAPGLSTFAEYDYIQLDAATTATTGSNDANVFMVGTKVSF
jgi:predicted porin